MTITETNCQGDLPDLIFNPDAVNPTISTEPFADTHCAVEEGCVLPGTRRLLRFTSEARNIGTSDLMLGDPATNSR